MISGWSVLLPVYRVDCDGAPVLMELAFDDLETAAREACLWAKETGSELQRLENLDTGQSALNRCDQPGSPILPPL